MAGLGGALYVPQVGIINPGEFAPAGSIEAVIWVAVGGRGTLYGAILGAVLVNAGENLVHRPTARSCGCSRWAGCSSLSPSSSHAALIGLVPQARAPKPVDRTPPKPRVSEEAVPMTTIGPVADTLLYLDGVSVSFDGFRALNNLSLVLAPGEMRAVIGPNGAGKTTMMDVITGKTRPDTGRVVYAADTDLTRLDEPAIASLGIGRKFQKPTVFEPHTVWDNLLLALSGRPPPLVHPGRTADRGGAKTGSRASWAPYACATTATAGPGT